MPDITVKVGGLADLKRALDELREDLRKKVVRGALRDAAKPIVQAARSLAPVLRTLSPYRTPGLVRKSIQVAASKQFNGAGGELGVFIRVRPTKAKQRRAFKKQTGLGGAKNPNDPFYWRFLELGTRKMTARPFLQPSAESNFDRALEIFSQKIIERIAKANNRK